MMTEYNIRPFVRVRAQATPQRRSIEVDGVFLGTVVAHELGVRFIAGDVRVTEMDQSIWPTPEYAEKSARQLFRSGRAAQRL